MTSRLLVIRHAESRANVARLVGANEVCTGLTDVGREQAGLLAGRFAATGPIPDVAYASSVRRAQETCAVLTERLGIAEATVERDLRELDPGAAEGMTAADYEAVYGPVADWREERADVPLAPGGETWRALIARAGRMVRGLLAAHPDETVVAVSHGGFIAAAVQAVLNVDLASRSAIINVAHTSITELHETDGVLHLLRVGDVGHLASPEGGLRSSTSPTAEATPR
ncbi:MAG TPA: histidine phosphatase family protein [Streptosporangiales bacterium]